MKEITVKISDEEYYKLLNQVVFEGYIKEDTYIKVREIIFKASHIESVNGELI